MRIGIHLPQFGKAITPGGVERALRNDGYHATGLALVVCSDAEVVDHDRGALSSELQRVRAAQPSARAGDDGNPTFQVRHVSTSVASSRCSSSARCSGAATPRIRRARSVSSRPRRSATPCSVTMASMSQHFEVHVELLAEALDAMTEWIAAA